jgi:hypothetical protein
MGLDQDSKTARVIEKRCQSFLKQRWDEKVLVACLLIPLVPAYYVGRVVHDMGWIEVYSALFILAQIGLAATLPARISTPLAQNDINKMKQSGVFDPVQSVRETDSPITIWVNERFSYIRKFSPRVAIVVDFSSDTETVVEKEDSWKLFEVIEMIERDKALKKIQIRKAVQVARRAFCMTVVGEADKDDSFRTLSSKEIVDKIVNNILR